MPRPVFGEADWWTFDELNDESKFPRYRGSDWDGFCTATAAAADSLACRAWPDADDEDVPAEERDWDGVEFCVARQSKLVLMVRLRQTK